MLDYVYWRDFLIENCCPASPVPNMHAYKELKRIGDEYVHGNKCPYTDPAIITLFDKHMTDRQISEVAFNNACYYVGQFKLQQDNTCIEEHDLPRLPPVPAEDEIV